ncbi:hypothetical protein ACNSOL_11805 (plasmid) [Aliarcobacter lanthieri]|uniref:hypothetical protein n=1 Tax=Aliarcobacter lanthieri TaxID=1355374 RepID=UPI003AAFD400
MYKDVKYFKLRNERLNQDSIIKMTTNEIEDKNSITLELNFVLYKEDNKYKEFIGTGTNLVLTIEACLINNKIQLQGGTGRIFEIFDFYIYPYKLFEFKSLGLFSYFTSYLLRMMIDKYNIDLNVSDVNVTFPQSQVIKDVSCSEDYIKMNFIRKLKTYRKIGFKLKKVRNGKYNLQDTPVSKIKNIALPNSIKFYDYALELINDTKELIPFANEKIEPLIYDFYDFVDKEVITLDTSLDVTKVIGTSHPKYYRNTWIAAINNLRTPSYVEDLKLTSNKFGSIDFYKTKEHYKIRDDPWGIKLINGKYYISEGNHRTIISKFLNSLGLIEDNIKGLKYIKQFEINNRDKIKYFAIRRWLKIYYFKFYSDFDYVLKVRNKEARKNRIDNNTEEIFYERTYEVLIRQSITANGDKIRHVMSFNSLEALKKYIQEELYLNRYIYKFDYLSMKIKRRFLKLDLPIFKKYYNESIS